MKENTKLSIISLIKNDARSWLTTQVLDILISTIFEIKESNEQLRTIISEPFRTGEDYLVLSKNQLPNSPEYNDYLKKAEENFLKSANLMAGLERCHSYYLAGICSDLLGKKGAKKIYFKKSYSAIISYENEKKEKCEFKADMVGFAGGVGGFIASIGIVGGIVLLPFTLPFALPHIVVIGGIGHIAQKSAEGARKKVKAYKGIWEETNCPIPNTDWYELKQALKPAK